MKEKIQETLSQIEQSYEVKIILAVESGSRSWGIPSESSDYDVRFLYVPRKEWYFSIEEKRDVIDFPVDNRIDLHGWELRKALRLLNKNNPHLLEWLHSSIIYFQDEQCISALREIAQSAFSSKSALFHYINMAKRNHLEFLQGHEVKIKKYFYVIRPILACLWIEKHKCYPPLDFQELVQGTLASCAIKESILSLIQQKRAGVESGTTIQFTELHHYMQLEIERISNYAKSLAEEHVNLIPQLDVVFRELLQYVWELDEVRTETRISPR
ncbi:nucleotidyltransferase domain-containing protein [Bacillus marasmi]|uniref:nucleotidyltransferase domain-containing protein n=1 Tax=Bacillus marasmi TaxID=1926279 RepID=UPI0011C7472A|nr:nucleotidyltransferase domain-containing protein [Bacillus marasmi]